MICMRKRGVQSLSAFTALTFMVRIEIVDVKICQVNGKKPG